jgi:hypothetical protein
LPVLGRVRLNEIDRREVDAFFASLTERELSPKYCRGGNMVRALDRSSIRRGTSMAPESVSQEAAVVS